jgi:hypothetical protein
VPTWWWCAAPRRPVRTQGAGAGAAARTQLLRIFMRKQSMSSHQPRARAAALPGAAACAQVPHHLGAMDPFWAPGHPRPLLPAAVLLCGGALHPARGQQEPVVLDYVGLHLFLQGKCSGPGAQLASGALAIAANAMARACLYWTPHAGGAARGRRTFASWAGPAAARSCLSLPLPSARPALAPTAPDPLARPPAHVPAPSRPAT